MLVSISVPSDASRKEEPQRLQQEAKRQQEIEERQRNLALVVTWIERDPEFKEILKALLAGKEFGSFSNSVNISQEVLAALLDAQKQKSGWQDLIFLINGLTGIIVAIPAIMAMILSIMALLHR